MKRIMVLMIVMILPALSAVRVSGQDLVVYPAKGQTQEQMEKDKYDCYQWAKQQTGFDPMNFQPRAQAAPVQSQGPKGERIRGAARGATVGAVVGEIANDDAGKGAAAGAAGGAMVGGMRARQSRRQETAAQQQQTQQQASADAQKRGDYDRAFSACLEGKGYTVK